MKTTTKRKAKTRKTSRSAKLSGAGETSQVCLVRDLMKPIYIFGQHDSPIEFVTCFEEARARLQAGKNFYVRVGDRVYYADIRVYRLCGMPLEQITLRLQDLFI